ncbi:hypothetical protein SAMN05660900_00548 [Megasphaera cerevisiae DSM 20462]|nr:hypothetical protein SAMN05660900_00548 [Megasphaera cerevisiae DSM 20462]
MLSFALRSVAIADNTISPACVFDTVKFLPSPSLVTMLPLLVILTRSLKSVTPVFRSASLLTVFPSSLVPILICAARILMPSVVCNLPTMLMVPLAFTGITFCIKPVSSAARQSSYRTPSAPRLFEKPAYLVHTGKCAALEPHYSNGMVLSDGAS